MLGRFMFGGSRLLSWSLDNRLRICFWFKALDVCSILCDRFSRLGLLVSVNAGFGFGAGGFLLFFVVWPPFVVLCSVCFIFLFMPQA